MSAWMIKAGPRTYGPFTVDQLRDFVAQGRLARHSLIARDGETDWRQAGDEPELEALFGGGGESARPAPPSEDYNQFVILLDLKSASVAKIEQTLRALGRAHELMPNVWLLSGAQSLNAVRNQLIQDLGTRDALFVVDATHGKATWFNFGPEAEARIRHAWRKSA